MKSREIALRNETTRLAILDEIYRTTESDINIKLEQKNLDSAKNYSETDVSRALMFLHQEGLIKGFIANRTGVPEIFAFHLTHKGIIEVEAAYRRPSQPTEHFSTQVIQHFHSHIGAVQTGTNTANIIEKPKET